MHADDGLVPKWCMDPATPRRTLTASCSGLVKTEYRVMFFRSRSSSSKFIGFLSNLWLAGYAKIVTNYIYTPGFEGAAVAGAFEIIYMICICTCPQNIRERQVNDGYLLELWSRCSPLPIVRKSFCLSVIDDDEWLRSFRDADAQEILGMNSLNPRGWQVFLNALAGFSFNCFSTTPSWGACHTHTVFFLVN